MTTSLCYDSAELLRASQTFISEYRDASWQSRHDITLSEYIMAGLRDEGLIPGIEFTNPDLGIPSDFLEAIRSMDSEPVGIVQAESQYANLDDLINSPISDDELAVGDVAAATSKTPLTQSEVESCLQKFNAQILDRVDQKIAEVKRAAKKSQQKLSASKRINDSRHMRTTLDAPRGLHPEIVAVLQRIASLTSS